MVSINGIIVVGYWYIARNVEGSQPFLENPDYFFKCTTSTLRLLTVLLAPVECRGAT